MVWAVDFQFDATSDGRPIKIASIIDEHTRECLGGLVDRSITAHVLIDERIRLAFIPPGLPPAALGPGLPGPGQLRCRLHPPMNDSHKPWIWPVLRTATGTCRLPAREPRFLYERGLYNILAASLSWMYPSLGSDSH